MKIKNQSENISVFENTVQSIMELEAAAGMAIAVVDTDGVAVYENYFGCRDAAKSLPIDGDTVFGLASITKSFTALAITQLDERSVIDIQEPVQRYLPELKRGDITLAHLLCHSAGFYPLTRRCVELKKTEQTDPYYSAQSAQQATSQLIEGINAETVFTGKPGENFSYSNDSYALLCEIVRRFGGEPTFAQYVDKNILAPLKMTRSGCGLLWEDANITTLYQMRDGAMADDWTFWDDASSLPGAGGMKSTLNDMKKYAAMYLNEGKSTAGTKLLGVDGVRRMIRPRIGCALNQYYGYGLMVKPMGDLTVVGHGGDMPGISAHFEWSYESGVAVIILCNTSQVEVEPIADMAMRLASGQGVVGRKEPIEPVEWTDDKMEAVCGEYLSGEGTFITVSKAGPGFDVTVDGAATVAYPINRYMLRVQGRVEDMLVSVYRDENGAVYALGGGFRMLPKVKK